MPEVPQEPAQLAFGERPAVLVGDAVDVGEVPAELPGVGELPVVLFRVPPVRGEQLLLMSLLGRLRLLLFPLLLLVRVVGYGRRRRCR